MKREGGAALLSLIIALALAIPVLLFLIVFIWYMNLSFGDAADKIRAMRTTLEKIIGASPNG